MCTIGVARGFGDFELVSIHGKVSIKPFLSCHPEIQIFDRQKCKENDVVVMGSDGLWDVLGGNEVTIILDTAVTKFHGKQKYVSAATGLVGVARGSFKERWIMSNGKGSSLDDISAFVIPVYFNPIGFCNTYSSTITSSEQDECDAEICQNDKTLSHNSVNIHSCASSDFEGTNSISDDNVTLEKNLQKSTIQEFDNKVNMLPIENDRLINDIHVPKEHSEDFEEGNERPINELRTNMACEILRCKNEQNLSDCKKLGNEQDCSELIMKLCDDICETESHSDTKIVFSECNKTSNFDCHGANM